MEEKKEVTPPAGLPGTLKEELQTKFIENFNSLKPDEKKFLLTKVLSSQGFPTQRGSAYYHEKYALELIEDFKLMFQNKDKKSILFYAMEDYPHLKINTLKIYITNAFDFIVKNWDTEDKAYANFRAQIVISPSVDGVRVLWRKAAPGLGKRGKLISADDPLAIPIEEKVSKNWEYYVNEFMEMAEEKGASLMLPNKEHPEPLNLTDQEIFRWRQIFEESIIFGGMIERNKILIRKLE